MPYLIEERPADSGKWGVFKEGQDKKAVGNALNKKPYASRKAAEPYLRALYVAMKKRGEVVKELDLTVLSPDGAGLDPVLSQEYVEYTETSTDPNAMCSKCVFFAAPGFCYLVASYPLTIRSEGWCDQFTELSILTDPAGVSQMTTDSNVIHEMSTDLPIASGNPSWDAGAARAHIWTWATDDKGEVDLGKAAQAFLIRDGEGKDGLKDPIADVIDGHLEVVPAALRAAASRLPQSDAEGKSGAARVLEHYKKQAHIGEFERAALEDFVISEYKGSVPEVPDAPGVDKKALTEGDSKPTFVIRPIAQVGRTSKNGILYDQALIDSIREQIVQNHPIGIFGHIKEEDRPTAHPIPQAYWIGAKQYGDKLYAKAYIADMERAADIRKKKALNSADGTSIYGKGVKSYQADGTIKMTDFTLESLDFAPVDRASLDMGKEMYITSEMADSMTPMPPPPANPDPDNDGDNDLTNPNEDNEMTEVTDPMVAMTANWKTMGPDAICEQLAGAMGTDVMGKVAEAYLAKNNKKAVAMEMAVVEPTVISEFEKQKTAIDTLTVQVAELNATNVNFQRREFESALAQQVAAATPYSGSEPKYVKATAETRQILELKARMALKESLNVAQIAETVQAVVTDSPAIMEMWRDTLMGPSSRVNGLDNRSLNTTAPGYYNRAVDVNDPKFQEEARTRVGV